MSNGLVLGTIAGTLLGAWGGSREYWTGRGVASTFWGGAALGGRGRQGRAGAVDVDPAAHRGRPVPGPAQPGPAAGRGETGERETRKREGGARFCCPSPSILPSSQPHPRLFPSPPILPPPPTPPPPPAARPHAHPAFLTRARVSTHTQIDVLTRIYPCGECASHFAVLVRARPPDTSSGPALRAWACEAHNAVNASLGKPAFNCRLVGARWAPLVCGEGVGGEDGGGACALK